MRMAAGDIREAKRYRDWACRLAPRDPEIARRSKELPISDTPTGLALPKRRLINPAAVPHISAGLRSARATNFTDALKAFRRAVTIDPTCAEALNNIGMVYSELGQHDAAEEAFRSAISNDGENPDYRVNLARLLMRQKRWNEAMQECEAALSHDPDDLEASTLRTMIQKQRLAER